MASEQVAKYKNTNIEIPIYREIEILGRKAYVSKETIEMAYILMAAIHGREKQLSDLPPDAYFLSLHWVQRGHKKWGRPTKALTLGKVANGDGKR